MLYPLKSGFISSRKDSLTPFIVDDGKDILLKVLMTTKFTVAKDGYYSEGVEELYNKSLTKNLLTDNMDDIDTVIQLFNELLGYRPLSTWIRLQYRNLRLSELHNSFLNDVNKLFYSGDTNISLDKYVGLLTYCSKGTDYGVPKDLATNSNEDFIYNILSMGDQNNPRKGLYEMINFLKVAFGK